MALLNLAQLNATLEDVGARWKATQPAEEHQLGFVPGPEDHSLEEREHIARASYRRFMSMAPAMAAAAPLYPPSIDWRHYPAHPPLPAGNYVTPVRDQKSCGSQLSSRPYASTQRIQEKQRTYRKPICSTAMPKQNRGGTAAARTAAGGRRRL